MSFRKGKTYKIKQLSRSSEHWSGVHKAVQRRTKQGINPLSLEELYDVKWNNKPFPWSYFKEFRPNRRWFYHGTSVVNIQKILDVGFIASTGGKLDSGVYATYHTDLSHAFSKGQNYLISVMIYTPKILLINPGCSIDTAAIQKAHSTHDAIEIRSGAIWNGHQIHRHEICVFDARRVVPRFVLKVN